MVGQSFEHGFAESALGVVVFDEDDPAGLACRGGEGGGVYRLDGVKVDDPRRDALIAQRLGRSDAIVQGDAGPDEGDLIGWRGAQHFAATDGELLAMRRRAPGRRRG